MHRDVLEINGKKNLYGDHINFNGLDNRRKNLRTATYAQSVMHQRKLRKGLSKYKGVQARPKNRWLAMIRHKGKQIYLGSFKNEKMAALAYDFKAKELFGEFAYTNIRQKDFNRL